MNNKPLEKIGGQWHLLDEEFRIVGLANESVLAHLEKIGGFEIHGCTNGLGEVDLDLYATYLEEAEGEFAVKYLLQAYGN